MVNTRSIAQNERRKRVKFEADLENAIAGAHNCARTLCHEAGHGTKIRLDPDNANYFRRVRSFRQMTKFECFLKSVIAEDESESATHYVIAEHPTKDQLMLGFGRKSPDQ
ncbi:hypothetical protein niasHT_033983 [Heterodera trifolii]|uniref:Uncharacterized protein n=1 Tax=Heterodera trifolii TaxID=157864 RepID=A0ABD2IJL3_9BILA